MLRAKMILAGRVKNVFVLLTSVILLMIAYSSYNYQPVMIRNKDYTQNDRHYKTLLSVSDTVKQHSHHAMANISTHKSTTTQDIASIQTIMSDSTLARTGSFLDAASTKTKGYIVARNIYEQQTMASGNLLQLQCWASYLNMVVVKPLMKDSNMLTPLSATKQLGMLRMEDTFDMQDWEEYTRHMEYAPLVEWAEFVSSAPRKLIIVQVKYANLGYVYDVIAKGGSFPHPPSGEKLYAEGCNFKFALGKGLSYLRSKGFDIVRKVCLNFRIGDELTMTKIKEHILGEYAQENEKVSIIIDMWRGIGDHQRIIIKEKVCQDEKSYREHTKPSERLLHDAQVYAQKYLRGKDGNAPYVAVMARLEMTGLIHGSKKTGQNESNTFIPKCLQLTNADLQVVKSVKHIQRVLLSMDIGKYGSFSFKRKHYLGHLSEMEGFVEKLQGMTVVEWEKTFESVTETRDSGYIGMLQLVLVAKADCILFVGGGTFQRHALHVYQELHTNQTARCVRVVEKCTSPYRPVVK